MAPTAPAPVASSRLRAPFTVAVLAGALEREFSRDSRANASPARPAPAGTRIAPTVPSRSSVEPSVRAGALASVSRALEAAAARERPAPRRDSPLASPRAGRCYSAAAVSAARRGAPRPSLLADDAAWSAAATAAAFELRIFGTRGAEGWALASAARPRLPSLRVVPPVADGDGGGARAVAGGPPAASLTLDEDADYAAELVRVGTPFVDYCAYLRGTRRT